MNKFLISKNVLTNTHQIIHTHVHPLVQMQVRWDVREKLRFHEVNVYANVSNPWHQ